VWNIYYPSGFVCVGNSSSSGSVNNKIYRSDDTQ